MALVVLSLPIIIASATATRLVSRSDVPLITRSGLLANFLNTSICRSIVSCSFNFSTHGAISPSAFDIICMALASFFARVMRAFDRIVSASTRVLASFSALSRSASAVTLDLVSYIRFFTRCTSNEFWAVMLSTVTTLSSLILAMIFSTCAMASLSLTCSAFNASAPDVVSCSRCSSKPCNNVAVSSSIRVLCMVTCCVMRCCACLDMIMVFAVCCSVMSDGRRIDLIMTLKICTP
mmetsp:Transcript_33223/g.37777  ORF Transcript_33223/g.37777 Transcript_33223/m.37777 type:complete len:236 (-) Transcript_33223:774-1481(-)